MDGFSLEQLKYHDLTFLAKCVALSLRFQIDVYCIYSGDNHPPTTSLDPDTYYLIRYCHSSQEQEKIPPVLQLQPPSLVLVSPTDFQMFRYSSPRLPSPKVTLSS